MLVTTFTMIAFSGKRSEESERIMNIIRSREWGLLLMDEVHVVPAAMFRTVGVRQCGSTTAYHTATDTRALGPVWRSWTRCTWCPRPCSALWVYGNAAVRQCVRHLIRALGSGHGRGARGARSHVPNGG